MDNKELDIIKRVYNDLCITHISSIDDSIEILKSLNNNIYDDIYNDYSNNELIKLYFNNLDVYNNKVILSQINKLFGFNGLNYNDIFGIIKDKITDRYLLGVYSIIDNNISTEFYRKPYRIMTKSEICNLIKNEIGIINNNLTNGDFSALPLYIQQDLENIDENTLHLNKHDANEIKSNYIIDKIKEYYNSMYRWRYVIISILLTLLLGLGIWYYWSGINAMVIGGSASTTITQQYKDKKVIENAERYSNDVKKSGISNIKNDMEYSEHILDVNDNVINKYKDPNSDKFWNEETFGNIQNTGYKYLDKNDAGLLFDIDEPLGERLSNISNTIDTLNKGGKDIVISTSAIDPMVDAKAFAYSELDNNRANSNFTINKLSNKITTASNADILDQDMNKLIGYIKSERPDINIHFEYNTDPGIPQSTILESGGIYYETIKPSEYDNYVNIVDSIEKNHAPAYKLSYLFADKYDNK